MTKLQKNRYETISRLMRSHGIQHKENLFISFWDLAFNINNTWQAKHFCDAEKFKTESTIDFVIPNYHLYFLFPAIKHGVRNTDIEVLKGKNQTEYLVMVDENQTKRSPHPA